MKRIYFLVLSAFLSVVAFAQSKTDINVDLNKGSSGGGFPWLWVVGAIVFIILLVALLGGSRSGSDRIIERKTIVKE